MKQLATLGISIVIVAVLVGGAMAAGPMGPGGGPCAMAPADCPLAGAANPEQAQKFAQFQKEILPQKQQMLQLKTDLMGLRAQPNPDWKAIADKQKQMVDVKVEIQKKAAAAGFPAWGAGRCGMGMCGQGMGKCGMMGGMGMGGGMGMMGGMGAGPCPNCPLATPPAAK